MRARRTLLGLLAALGASLALGVGSASAAPLPVTYSFLDALARQGATPNGSPPGANDYSCRPSAAHPEPVVLVHGLLANQTVEWETISPLLVNDGYCVFSLTYGTRPEFAPPLYQPGGLTAMEASAAQLATFVDGVLAATGAEEVDIVGHSEGSLMPNYFVKFLGGAAVVDDYVGLTTLWAGTNVAGLATLAQLGQSFGLTEVLAGVVRTFCEACDQFLAGSAFMNKMNEGGPAHPEVDYTNIVTRYDELVVPYTSGLMAPGPNVENHVIQDHCELDLAEHLAVIVDPITTTLILNALAPAHARPVPCTLVLPAIGAPGYPPPAPLDSDGDQIPDADDPCPTHAGDPAACPASASAAAATVGATGTSAKPRDSKALRRCKKLKRPKAARRCARKARRRAARPL